MKLTGITWCMFMTCSDITQLTSQSQTEGHAQAPLFVHSSADSSTHLAGFFVVVVVFGFLCFV